MNTFIKLNHVAAIALAGCMAASLAACSDDNEGE